MEIITKIIPVYKIVEVCRLFHILSSSDVRRIQEMWLRHLLILFAVVCFMGGYRFLFGENLDYMNYRIFTTLTGTWVTEEPDYLQKKGGKKYTPIRTTDSLL